MANISAISSFGLSRSPWVSLHPKFFQVFIVCLQDGLLVWCFRNSLLFSHIPVVCILTMSRLSKTKVTGKFCIISLGVQPNSGCRNSWFGEKPYSGTKGPSIHPEKPVFLPLGCLCVRCHTPDSHNPSMWCAGTHVSKMLPGYMSVSGWPQVSTKTLPLPHWTDPWQLGDRYLSQIQTKEREII